MLTYRKTNKLPEHYTGNCLWIKLVKYKKKFYIFKVYVVHIAFFALGMLTRVYLKNFFNNFFLFLFIISFI